MLKQTTTGIAGKQIAKRTERDTKGAMRAAIIEAARAGGKGSELVIKRKRYANGTGNLEATSELLQKVENALNGWGMFLEVTAQTSGGNLIVLVKQVPPEF